jgi:hypothetical protein
MFGLFKKKMFTFPSDSKWSVGQGASEGKPIFIRRNTSATTLAGHADYKFRIGVAILLHEPNSEGLPNKNEMEQINVIEDQLWENLEKDQNSLHVLTITTQSMREFIFYSRLPDVATASIENIRQKTQTHEIQSYVAEDYQWNVYKQFS